MKKLKKWLALFAMAAGIVSSANVTAFAYAEEPAQTEPVEAASETEPTVLEENVQETEATPFSVPGNGQVVDDKTNDDTKEFLTIQTKNGNTFFLVLDRSSNTENVYMLSMIDENDLAEFIENTSEMNVETEAEAAQVVIPESETIPEETEVETEKEQEKEKAGVSTGVLLAALLLLAGGIGGFYYLKVVKPKKAEEAADEEDLEFYDGGAYINEDTDEDSESEDGE
jgi:hypothetical protein